MTFSGNRVVFNPRRLSNAGYVYLANRQREAFAVGMRSSGSIVLKQWVGSRWE